MSYFFEYSPVVRSVLPFTMLSVAEIFQPNFFLLENVTGLLQHSISNKAKDGKRVKKATFKLIYRGLIALGYQVRCKVLQAGQYGAPQGRQRVIFLAAKRGCSVPEFPIPTHAFLKSAQAYTLFNNDCLPPVKRGRGSDDNHLFAPHASVTIEDAIGDLVSKSAIVVPALVNSVKISLRSTGDVAVFWLYLYSRSPGETHIRSSLRPPLT